MTSTVSEKRSATCRSRWSDVTDRALDAVATWLYPPEHDALAARAIGCVVAGALILLYAALRLTPSKIGA